MFVDGVMDLEIITNEMGLFCGASKPNFNCVRYLVYSGLSAIKILDYVAGGKGSVFVSQAATDTYVEK